MSQLCSFIIWPKYLLNVIKGWVFRGLITHKSDYSFNYLSWATERFWWRSICHYWTHSTWNWRDILGNVDDWHLRETNKNGKIERPRGHQLIFTILGSRHSFDHLISLSGEDTDLPWTSQKANKCSKLPKIQKSFIFNGRFLKIWIKWV